MKNATIQFNGRNAYGLSSRETESGRLAAFPLSIKPLAVTLRSPPFLIIPEVDDRIEVNIKPDDLRLDNVPFWRQGRPKRKQSEETAVASRTSLPEL